MSSNYLSIPKLFNTGFIKNDDQLRLKQGLPIQNFGGICNIDNTSCNKTIIYPIKNISLNYPEMPKCCKE